MNITIHQHALDRMKERGATRADVEYTVKHGTRESAKFGRILFKHSFVFNRKWLGQRYGRKIVEAYAVNVGGDDWLVVTVIVKYH